MFSIKPTFKYSHKCKRYDYNSVELQWKPCITQFGIHDHQAMLVNVKIPSKLN